MPQPADPRAADKLVALDHEPAVLRAVYREAAAGASRMGLDGELAEAKRARINVTRAIRTGSRCRYCPPNQPA